MFVRLLRCWLAWGLGLLAPVLLFAHNLSSTKVTASFDEPGSINFSVELDLAPFITPEAYQALGAAPPAAQQAAVGLLVPEINAGLQLLAGSEELKPVFVDCRLPQGTLQEFLDFSVQKITRLSFRVKLPAVPAPLRLAVPYDSKVGHPVVFVARIPSARISSSCVMDDAGSVSDAFDWATEAPGRKTGPDGSSAGASRLGWPHELVTYLGAGFRHIIPEGIDHILFVLGLFFLGLTWRKLLAQTTVFTLAHATTLLLSTYGVFSLPSRWVEPAIALSIAFIAFENVYSEKLGPGRLAVVFGFGLVHGLGFASSLQELAFPQHDFIVALLGFNLGVDFGQLCVIGLALLTVGWFRDKPWFRDRVAIPCSLALAATGLVWASVRIWHYWIQSGHLS